MGNPSIAADTEAIVEWKRATGARKTMLFNALFRAKAGLIRKLAMKAARAEKTSEDPDDIVQAGAIGFQKALDGFDPGRGLSISTYAAWWIKHEVQRVARTAPAIALPRIRLTNEERARTIAAVKEDPDVAPESLGIRRPQLEQVKASFGIRYVSDDTPRGGAALERKLLANADLFDGEETLERARAYRALDGIILRVRAGASAESLGLSPEAFEMARELIRDEDSTMTDATETTNETSTPKRKPGRPKASHTRRAPTPRHAPKAPGVREQLVERLLAAERAKIMARIAQLDETFIGQLLASYA